MIIDFPDHEIGPWEYTPLWLFWKPSKRRKHWRWVVDHFGCCMDYYWEYR